MVEAIEEVKRILPWSRATMSRTHVLGEVDGRAHVEVDDPQLVRGARAVGELAAGADAGVERDRVDRAAGGLDAALELLDPGLRGEVDLNRLDVRAEALELACGAGELGVLRGDDEVVAVGGELLGQFEADAARGAGDDGERARGGGGHGGGLPDGARERNAALGHGTLGP